MGDLAEPWQRALTYPTMSGTRESTDDAHDDYRQVAFDPGEVPEPVAEQAERDHQLTAPMTLKTVKRAHRSFLPIPATKGRRSGITAGSGKSPRSCRRAARKGMGLDQSVAVEKPRPLPVEHLGPKNAADLIIHRIAGNRRHREHPPSIRRCPSLPRRSLGPRRRTGANPRAGRKDDKAGLRKNDDEKDGIDQSPYCWTITARCLSR